MSVTVPRAGRYAFGFGTTVLAMLVFGIGIVHFLAAVPHALLPIVAGVLLFVAGIGVTPAGHQFIERLVGTPISSHGILVSFVCAIVLCAAAVGIAVVFP